MDQQTITNIQAALDSPGGKVLWMLAKAVITIFITTSVGIGVSYIHDIRDDVTVANEVNVRQDLSIQSLQQESDSFSKFRDTAIVTMQQIGNQVTHNTDAIQNIKDVQKANTLSQRPGGV